MNTIDRALHASDIESLEGSIMEVALARTGAHHGALMLWNEAHQGLAIHFHVVEGLIVTLPDEVIPLRKDDRDNGVAAHVYLTNAPYVCDYAPTDPFYAPYFFDVASIAAVPIQYQERPIGVLSVSSRRREAFDAATLAALVALASSSAMFLRRAQLSRAEGRAGRPFLIKGLSREWLEVERRIEKVSLTNAPVLVTGESGTGKELVAHAIHFNSQRANGAFVAVNCAAIPETLLESVLFGHVRGAFTGATADKRGEFHKAHGGTLFLDELGELPVPLQAKVLRAVEDGEVQPLGSNDAPQRVDVRLVAATNRDLPAMAREGRFREDLYFRLSVMTMELPPLRTYKQDNLGIIAQVFVKQAAERHGRDVRQISADALARLYAHDYPGNVRELKNAMEHAVIMASGSTIEPEDLPRAIAPSETIQSAHATGAKDGGSGRDERERAPTLAEMRERWLAPLEGQYLTELLQLCGGNVRAAAERAGVNAVTMYRLLAKRGMTRTRGRSRRARGPRPS